MKRIREKVLEYMRTQESSGDTWYTTQELSEALTMQRTNLSRILNELVKEKLVRKTNGRPVYYALEKEREQSCFRAMIGCDGSLKQAVQMLKAAILYPGHPMPVLIKGEDGSGKSMLAQLIYEFACEQNIIAENAPFVKINSRYLVEESLESVQKAFFCQSTGAMDRAAGGVLFVDHINRLAYTIQNELLDYVEKAQKEHGNVILVYSIDDLQNADCCRLYTSKFSACVDLPSLASRPLKERRQLIDLFLKNEAACIHKTIRIRSEVLHCLMLYPGRFEVRQLQADIRLGCANGYARSRDKEETQIELHVHDFPGYVRKGLLSWQTCRVDLEKLVEEHSIYSFTSEGVSVCADERVPALSDKLYCRSDPDKDEQEGNETSGGAIMQIVEAQMEHDFRQIQCGQEEKKLSRERMAKLVDEKLIVCVETFLNEASVCLDRIYATSVFYALCLHLSALKARPDTAQKLSDEQIVTTIREHNTEFALCSRFGIELEKEFGFDLPVDEIALLALLISKEQIVGPAASRPVVLVAMHGNSTASSIVEVVNTLVGDANIFAFDLPLDMDMQKAYEELKRTFAAIHQGEGVLMMYDMGSLKTMAEMIGEETGIPVKSLCVPATLLALDCSRKAGCHGTLDQIYKDVIDSFTVFYPEIARSSRRQEKPQVILSLCMSGAGGALQIKNYIEQHTYLENTEIVPLAISDPGYLLKKVNQIRTNQKIVCVIGAYDPQLYGIPYIPVSRLFDTSPDKLDMLLSLNTAEPVRTLNYGGIYEYLEEQMEGFDFLLLKEVMPGILRKIRQVVPTLSSDQEVGLFMHIACLIYRLQNDGETPKNVNTKQLILKNKRLYNDLCEILHTAEEEFYIRFQDDDVANMIQMIRMC